MSKYYDTMPSVSAPACSYARLSNYNTPSGIAVPRTIVTGKMIVPNNQPPGYDTLSGGPNAVPSCNGYFTIDSAYGSGQCNTQYVTSLCQ